MRLLIVTQKVDREDENLGFFHGWIEEFAKHFSEVIVISQKTGSFHFPDNVKVFTFGGGESRLQRLWKFWELFSRHYAESEGVFFHMIPEVVVAAGPFLLSLRKKTCLWYTHKSVTWKLKIAEKLVDFVFTASPLSFRLPSKKVLYTGHAIDTTMFKPGLQEESNQLRMVTVGRISPIKDYERIIHACVLLNKNWDHAWKLSIVGGPLMPRDHEYLTRLKSLVKEHNLENLITFEGPRAFTEIPQVYNNNDMFLSMSTTGSIDKAVLEACASGLVVVTSNEAFKDLLPSQYFVEKRSPEFLAERIKARAGNSKPVFELRELVEKKHSLHHTIKLISDVYTQF